VSDVRIPPVVKRVFLETFTASDVAEPLGSFDSSTNGAVVRAAMAAANMDVAGIRKGGRIEGYVARDSVAEGECGQYCLPLDSAPVLSSEAALPSLLLALEHSPFVFIEVLGSVGGVVTRIDLQKAPVRMWLFGLITVIELRYTELIDRHCPAESWQRHLSAGRLQKAEFLLSERRRRQHSLRLLDCLQLADKGRIVAREPEILKETVFGSRRQAEDALKMLERLRNTLAHAQEIPPSDWETISLLCRFVVTATGD
jgi:hypothetical protein